MGTKTLTITEEAYERLKDMKRSDESFTDLVLRLTKGEEDVWKGCGEWTDTGFAEAVEEERERFDTDMEERDVFSG
jgi:predicted CopG family antitoxin